MEPEKSYILHFPSLDKKSVAWFLRFAYSGGTDGFYVDFSSCSSAEVVQRLQVLLAVGFQGPMRAILWKRFVALIIDGSLGWADFQWLYLDPAYGTVPHYAQKLTERIADAVMWGEMSMALKGARQNKVFYKNMCHLVGNMRDYIVWVQDREKQIPSVFQLDFVYTFSVPNSQIRKVLTRGLARLMNDGFADPEMDGFIAYSKRNKVFERDMTQAWNQVKGQERHLAKKGKNVLGNSLRDMDEIKNPPDYHTFWRVSSPDMGVSRVPETVAHQDRHQKWFEEDMKKVLENFAREREAPCPLVSATADGMGSTTEEAATDDKAAASTAARAGLRPEAKEFKQKRRGITVIYDKTFTAEEFKAKLARAPPPPEPAVPVDAAAAAAAAGTGSGSGDGGGKRKRGRYSRKRGKKENEKRKKEKYNEEKEKEEKMAAGAGGVSWEHVNVKETEW